MTRVISSCAVLLLAGCAGNVADDSFMELPAIAGSDDVVYHTGYTASYNHKTLIPDWVAYELTAEEAQGDYQREGMFGQDPEMGGPQAWREDYAGSGWDKGHMAPAGDMKWGSVPMRESFYLTNICPQNHALNEGPWNDLEQKIRSLARRYGRVFVVCGPIVGENIHGTIGDSKVTVPDAFFKAILVPVDNGYEAVAFIMYNDSRRQPYRDCAVSVDHVESVTGMDLFPLLPDRIESEVEANASTSLCS